MIKSFDFYFDFVSPYSFLAHKEIRKIEKKYSIKVVYKPMLLGALHNLHGIKAPAFIPAKARFMIRCISQTTLFSWNCENIITRQIV